MLNSLRGVELFSSGVELFSCRHDCMTVGIFFLLICLGTNRYSNLIFCTVNRLATTAKSFSDHIQVLTSKLPNPSEKMAKFQINTATFPTQNCQCHIPKPKLPTFVSRNAASQLFVTPEWFLLLWVYPSYLGIRQFRFSTRTFRNQVSCLKWNWIQFTCLQEVWNRI